MSDRIVLTGHQIKLLVEEMARVYSYGRLALYLRTDFERDIETITLGDTTIQDVAFAVVDCALRESWIGRLLRSFTHGPYPSLAQAASLLLDSSTAPPGPLARPAAAPAAGPADVSAVFGVHLVWRRPFLDRAPLREHMRDLLSESATRVLVVTGERQSGRSYTWLYITHLRDHLRTFTPVLVDFSEWVGRICTPLDVMTEIAAQLRLRQPTVDRDAPGAAQAQQLRTWLVGELPADPGAQWVIVFDSIDHARLSQDTVQLMEYIAGAALLQRHPGLRVVLLGYANRFPLNLGNLVLTERLGAIGKPAVSDFLRTLAEDCGTPITDDAIEVTAEHVLQQLEKAPDGGGLDALHGLLAQAACAVFGREVL